MEYNGRHTVDNSLMHRKAREPILLSSESKEALTETFLNANCLLNRCWLAIDSS